ncbi:hypothetical protein U0070_000537, partial [Myodes glareolus]
ALGASGHCSDTAKSKRTTPHTTNPQNSTEIASRTLGRPQIPEEQVLCQEAQRERPEENAGKHLKVTSARAETAKALENAKVAKLKMPKGPSRKLSLQAWEVDQKLHGQGS